MALLTDAPVAGFYKTRLIRGGPLVPVRLWFGAPVIDGEEQDRAPRWCIEVAGKTDRIEKDEANPEYRGRVLLDVYRYWPYCATYPIDEAEYNYLTAHAEWATQHAKHMPDAQPRKAIDKRGASVF